MRIWICTAVCTQRCQRSRNIWKRMEANHFCWLNTATAWEMVPEILKNISACAVDLYGNGATMQLRMIKRKTERRSITMAEIMERRYMMVISVWMVLCIRTEPRIPDCSNTKMSTARSEFGHLIRREERLPFITIWILMIFRILWISVMR